MLGKLISLASLGGTVASVTMLQRFLAGLTGVIALTIVSAVMASILLAGGFVGIYVGLTRYGIAPDAAALIVGMIILAITLVSAYLAIIKLKELRELPFHGVSSEFPSLSKLASIANAFVDGLMAGKKLKASLQNREQIRDHGQPPYRTPYKVVKGRR